MALVIWKAFGGSEGASVRHKPMLVSDTYVSVSDTYASVSDTYASVSYTYAYNVFAISQGISVFGYVSDPKPDPGA